MKKRNFVEWAMHYRQIVILCVTCLVAFGIYSLPQMRKNEFPDFTIRQGIVVAVAPGNTAQEMVEQVAKPLEEYIFSYKEVKKEKTFSRSRDGIVYIQVQLNDDLNNQDEFERVILGQFTACSYNGTMYHLVKTGNDNTPKSYSIMTIRHLLELDGENEYVTTSMFIILTSAAMHSDTKIKAIRQIISQGVI